MLKLSRNKGAKLKKPLYFRMFDVPGKRLYFVMIEGCREMKSICEHSHMCRLRLEDTCRFCP